MIKVHASFYVHTQESNIHKEEQSLSSFFIVFLTGGDICFYLLNIDIRLYVSGFRDVPTLILT